MSRNSSVISKEIVEDIAFSLKFDLIKESDLDYVIKLSENINNGDIKIYNQPETIKFFRIKVEEFYMKIQVTNQKKISKTHISDKNLVSTKYNEFLQVNNKKTNNPVNK